MIILTVEMYEVRVNATGLEKASKLFINSVEEEGLYDLFPRVLQIVY